MSEAICPSMAPCHRPVSKHHRDPLDATRWFCPLGGCPECPDVEGEDK